jgi:hypothetical protein
MSKRFPTRELENRDESQLPMHPQKSLAPQKRAKPSVDGVDPIPAQNAEAPAARPASLKPRYLSKKANPTTEEHTQQFPSPNTLELKTSGSESEDYNLHPGPSKSKPISTSIEDLFALLYSEGYLTTLIRNPRLSQFTSFLTKYKRSLSPFPPITRNPKVTKAINYANAVALSLPPQNPSERRPKSDPFPKLQILLRNHLPNPPKHRPPSLDDV